MEKQNGCSLSQTTAVPTTSLALAVSATVRPMLRDLGASRVRLSWLCLADFIPDRISLHTHQSLTPWLLRTLSRALALLRTIRSLVA